MPSNWSTADDGVRAGLVTVDLGLPVWIFAPDSLCGDAVRVEGCRQVQRVLHVGGEADGSALPCVLRPFLDHDSVALRGVHGVCKLTLDQFSAAGAYIREVRLAGDARMARISQSQPVSMP